MVGVVRAGPEEVPLLEAVADGSSFWVVFAVFFPAVTGIMAGVSMSGDLNAVAPVLTMFFLTTYGMINMVARLEKLSGAPSYRPTIRVPWFVSLAGGVACFWVMSLISWPAALVALVVEVGLFAALRRRSMAASWGNMRYGTLMSLVRASFLSLRRLPVAPRNWRPHILVFAGDLERRIDLVRFAAWLNQDRGLLTVCHLEPGGIDELAAGPFAGRLLDGQVAGEEHASDRRSGGGADRRAGPESGRGERITAESGETAERET